MSDLVHSPVDTETAVVPKRLPRAWPPLVLALACAAGYAVVLVLPYYVNDLGRFPLADVAIGYHDPKDLWPYDGASSGLVWAINTVAYPVLRWGALFALGAIVWALVGLGRRKGMADTRGRTLLLAAVVVALGCLVFRASPLGDAMVGWWLD